MYIYIIVYIYMSLALASTVNVDCAQLNQMYIEYTNDYERITIIIALWTLQTIALQQATLGQLPKAPKKSTDK